MGGMPIFLDIECKKVVVIGGGRAALIKIRSLIDFNADIHVIANDICNEISELEKLGKITVCVKDFSECDLDGAFIVIAAADSQTNKSVYEAASIKKILCHSVNRSLKCDFIFPSHKVCGDITVAVSTNGKYPLIAKKICDNIDLSVNEKLDYFEKIRNIIISKVKEKEKRRFILKNIIDDNIINSEDYKNKIDIILERYL